MITVNTLTPKRIAEIKKCTIDCSNIPEITHSETLELYPRNWKPIKTAKSIRLDNDLLEWVQKPSKKCLNILG